VGGLDVSGGGGTNNVKLHLTRIVFEGEEWLHLAHNKNQWCDLANMTVNLNAARKANSYLTCRNTFNLSKMAQLVTLRRHTEHYSCTNQCSCSVLCAWYSTERGQVEKGTRQICPWARHEGI